MKKLSIIIIAVFFYGTTDGSILITNETKTEISFNDKKDKKVKSNCCKSSDKKKECSKENKNTCKKSSDKKECSNSTEKKSKTTNTVKKECCSKNKKPKCSKE